MVNGTNGYWCTCIMHLTKNNPFLKKISGFQNNTFDFKLQIVVDDYNFNHLNKI